MTNFLKKLISNHKWETQKRRFTEKNGQTRSWAKIKKIQRENDNTTQILSMKTITRYEIGADPGFWTRGQIKLGMISMYFLCEKGILGKTANEDLKFYIWRGPQLFALPALTYISQKIISNHGTTNVGTSPNSYKDWRIILNWTFPPYIWHLYSSLVQQKKQ